MGGPARGALGSQGGNAQPCRGPPGARRTREEELENERSGEKEGDGRRLGEEDPMVEGGNGGISKGLGGGKKRKGGGRPRGKGGPIKVNHLHFTDWITLSDRTWGLA